MRKRIFMLGLGLICLALTVTAQESKKTVTLHFVETTDVHGAFFPIDFYNERPANGSMARVSTYLTQLRKQYGDDAVIALDNGDILQGQPICYYYNFIRIDTTNIAADVINYLRYDAECVGNHDIEPGHPVYDKWFKEVKCPVLGANIIDNTTGKPYLKPYTILEKNGVRVAVIGMLTPAIPLWLNADIWSNLRFEELITSMRYWVNQVREQEHPDIVCGLIHSGWDGGITTPDYDEDAGAKIAEQIDGLDLLFFGHDHTEHNSVSSKGVLCMDPSCNAKKVAHAMVTLEQTSEGMKIIDKKGELVDICPLDIDQDFVSHFQGAIDDAKTYINKFIGVLSTPLRSRDCYFGSSAFTDLIHNLQLQITGADISITAPLAFDNTINAGNLYMRDMFKLYRFENRLYTMRLKGSEIKNHLEMSYALWTNTMTKPEDHILLLNDTIASDMQRFGFKNFTFNFDSAAGIDYEVDVTKPRGQKVHILRMSNGQPFDENKFYVVAMSSYRANGGGELLTQGAGIPRDSLEGRTLTMTELDLRYYLTKEIERMGTIDPKPNNNWRFVPEAWTVPALKRDRKQLFGD